MARVNIVGFETGDLSECYPYAGNTTGFTIESVIHRAGAYSCKYVGGSATNQLGVVGGTGGGSFLRFYLYIGILPASNGTIFSIVGSAGSSGLRIQLTSTGKLAAYSIATSAVLSTGATTLSTGLWYRIEATCSPVGASSTWAIKINGTAEISGTSNLGTNSGALQFLMGGSAVALTVYYDDVAVDNAAYPGPGSVRLQRASGVGGQYTSWVPNTSAGQWLQVLRETPIDVTTYDTLPTVSSPPTGAQSFRITMDSCGASGVYGTILAVKSAIVVWAVSGVGLYPNVLLTSLMGVDYTVTPGAYIGGAPALSALWAATVQRIDTTEPGGSTPWTHTDLDNYLMGPSGVQQVAGGTSIVCTSAYRMVEHDEQLTIPGAALSMAAQVPSLHGGSVISFPTGPGAGALFGYAPTVTHFAAQGALALGGAVPSIPKIAVPGVLPLVTVGKPPSTAVAPAPYLIDLTSRVALIGWEIVPSGFQLDVSGSMVPIASGLHVGGNHAVSITSASWHSAGYSGTKFGVRAYINGTPSSSSSQILYIHTSPGDVAELALSMSSTGCFFSGASGVTGSATDHFTVGTWHYVELFIDTSTGNWAVSIDGVVKGNGTAAGLNTGNALHQIGGSIFSTTFDYDDIAVSAVGQPGPGHVWELPPNGAGTHTGWGAPSYVGMGTYGGGSGASTSTDNDIFTFAVADESSVSMTGTEVAVQVYATIRVTSVGNVQLVLRSGGTDYFATVAIGFTGTDIVASAIWTSDPATGLPWTSAGVNAIEVGAKKIAGSGGTVSVTAIAAMVETNTP